MGARTVAAGQEGGGRSHQGQQGPGADHAVAGQEHRGADLGADGLVDADLVGAPELGELVGDQGRDEQQAHAQHHRDAQCRARAARGSGPGLGGQGAQPAQQAPGGHRGHRRQPEVLVGDAHGRQGEPAHQRPQQRAPLTEAHQGPQQQGELEQHGVVQRVDAHGARDHGPEGEQGAGPQGGPAAAAQAEAQPGGAQARQHPAGPQQQVVGPDGVGGLEQPAHHRQGQHVELVVLHAPGAVGQPAPEHGHQILEHGAFGDDQFVDLVEVVGEQHPGVEQVAVQPGQEVPGHRQHEQGVQAQAQAHGQGPGAQPGIAARGAHGSQPCARIQVASSRAIRAMPSSSGWPPS